MQILIIREFIFVKLLYLSETNLRDRLFVKDFVNGFSSNGKSLLIHSPLGDSVPDTRFASKRISSLLSESMVYNNAFSADQRGFFKIENGHIQVNVPLIKELLTPIQLLILAPIVNQEGQLKVFDPVILLLKAREVLNTDETIVFSENPLSPIGTQNITVKTGEEKSSLIKTYEEEKNTIEIAYRLRPARIASPKTFAT